MLVFSAQKLLSAVKEVPQSLLAIVNDADGREIKKEPYKDGAGNKNYYVICENGRKVAVNLEYGEERNIEDAKPDIMTHMPDEVSVERASIEDKENLEPTDESPIELIAMDNDIQQLSFRF